jgi:predicted nucleic acid-binding Zn ribbon protein
MYHPRYKCLVCGYPHPDKEQADWCAERDIRRMMSEVPRKERQVKLRRQVERAEVRQ